MTVVPIVELWPEGSEDNPPAAEPRHLMSLEEIDTALEKVYGKRRKALSDKARAQPRDVRGRFMKVAETASRAAVGMNRLRNGLLQIPPGVTQVHTYQVPTGGNMTFTWPDFDREIVATPRAATQAWTPITPRNTAIHWNQFTINTTAEQMRWYRDEERMANVWQEWISTTKYSVNTNTATYGTQNTGQWVTVRTVTDNQTARNVWREWKYINDREVLTAEEQERRDAELQRLRDEAQARREEQSRRRLAMAQQMEGAQQRAMQLLRLILSPVEKQHLENTGRIRVMGSEGNLYEVDTTYGGVHGNITRVDEHGCILGRLCVQPKMYDDNGAAIPLADGYIGQFLTLKHNEAEILAKANWSQRRTCQVENQGRVQTLTIPRGIAA